MKKSVYDYKDYKKYLVEALDSGPQGGRGSRSALAGAAGCQTAYVSQVLGGAANFSLEQADLINKFLAHSTEEADFFLLLVQLARAGTKSLSDYFLDQINRVLERRLVLKDRLDVKKSLSKEDSVLYYSQWYYSTLHVMLSIPKYQTKDALARYLGMPEARVADILDFLVSVGLAERVGLTRFKIGAARIHLGTDGVMLSKHHSNWRLMAIRSLERGANEDTHYSSVVTMSKDDVVKLKLLVVDFLKDVKAVIRDSKEEEVHAFCLDFFKV